MRSVNCCREPRRYESDHSGREDLLFFDAENLLTTAARDSIPEKWLPVRDAVLADCMIGDKQYREAIPLLRNAIKKAQGNYQKARMYFLLGQLYHAVGENAEAYKEVFYRKLIPDTYAQDRGGWKTYHIMKSVYTETFSEERQKVDKIIDKYFQEFV